MTHLLASALCCFLAATQASASALEDAARTLLPGQWAELKTVDFTPATLDDGAAYSVFWYAEDIAWAAKRRQLLFIGGGHGTDAELLTFDADTNRWSRTKPGGGPWNGNFSHAYDHLALVPPLSRLYFRQPASDQNEVLEILDLESGRWSRSPRMPARLACCGALEHFPELGGLVLVAGPGPVLLYSATVDDWRVLARNVGIGDYHNFAQYSPVHRVLIFGGGEGTNGQALYRMDAKGRIRRLADAPHRMGTTYSVVTTDPVTGHFLFFFDRASYEFNPVTQAWTPLAAAPPWLATGTPGLFGVVATPVADLGVVLVAKYVRDDPRVFLYRHGRE